MTPRWQRVFAFAMGIPLLIAILAACGQNPLATTSTSSASTPVKTSSPVQKHCDKSSPTGILVLEVDQAGKDPICAYLPAQLLGQATPTSAPAHTLTPAQMQQRCTALLNPLKDCDGSRFSQGPNPRNVVMANGDPVAIDLQSGVTAWVFDCNTLSHVTGPKKLPQVCAMDDQLIDP